MEPRRQRNLALLVHAPWESASQNKTADIKWHAKKHSKAVEIFSTKIRQQKEFKLRRRKEKKKLSREIVEAGLQEKEMEENQGIS
jgi:hypothetical protein